MPSNRPAVCLVIGAGSGIGSHVGRRFSSDGYHACLCRRTDSVALQQTVRDIIKSGGLASGFLLDVTKPGAIEDMVREIESRLGPIKVVVWNLGAQIGDKDLSSTTEKQFDLGWRLGCLGLFRLSKILLPLMADRESGGTLLVTSSTSALRGNAGQHSHASAMGGRRMLCQTLNAEFAGRGVHVSHVVVDGAVDSPDTLGKMIGPKAFRKLREGGGCAHRLIDPKAIAETFWYLAHQHPSAWTFELDLRSREDVAWWNSRL